MTKRRINFHSHLLPYPNQIPREMKDKKWFWITDDKKWMKQGDWQRPITDDSFFLEEKLVWMDQHKIDHSVILNLSQLYGNGLRMEEMKKVLRFQNDFQARVQKEHPSKFTCGFVVHAGFVKSAVWEIERCVEKHNLRVLCLPTHYMDSAGKWTSIIDEETKPIFETANKYKLAVQIHPYDGQKIIGLKDRAWNYHVAWMLAQCAEAYHFYTLDGYYDKYPDIRVSFAHGGQLAQVSHGRRTQAFDGRGDLFLGMRRPKDAIGHPNIFFDTLVHDTLSLELMVKRNKGTDQIILGLDDPYPLGEMENEKQSSYPGKLLDLAIEEGIITVENKGEIWHDNGLRWLGPECNILERMNG